LPDRQNTWQAFEENWQEVWDFIENLPDYHTSVVNPELYRIGEKDPLVLKLRKHGMAFSESYRHMQFTLAQVFKRKKPSAKYQSKRKIKTKRFLYLNYLLPAAQATLQEWNHYNRSTASVLHGFHDIFEKISLLQQKDSADQYNDKIITEKVSSFSDILSQKQKEALARNHETLNSIFNRADYYWHRAGTILISERRFNEAAYHKSQNKYIKSSQEFQSAWNTHWRGEMMDWQKDIDLSGITWKTIYTTYQTCNTVSELFAQHVIVRFSAIKEILIKNIQQVQKGRFTDKKSLSSFITQSRNILKEQLTDSYLPQTIDTLVGLGIDRHLDTCTKILTAVMEQMEKKHTIFKMKDTEKLVPESQIEDVPLKEIIINQPYKDLHSTVTDIRNQIQEKIIRITNDMSSLGDALNYNGETAQDLIYTSEAETTGEIIDEVLKTLQAGFDRAGDRLAEIQENTKTLIDIIIKNLLSASFDFIQEVDLLRKNDQLLKIKIELAQTRARVKFTQWRIYLYNTLGKIRKGLFYLLSLVRRFSKHLGNRFYHRLIKMTRLKETDIKDARMIQDYLKQAREFIEVQPIVYRRLFNFSPLNEEKLFVGRKNERQDFEESFNRWLKGNTGLIALVGERGSGRTTFVRIISKKIFQNIAVSSVRPDMPVLSTDALLEFLKDLFKKPKASSLDELEKILIDEDEKTVVILEDLHRMFLKTIDGLHTMQRFTLFMMHTDKIIFWVISCSYYAWNFLDRVIGIGALFGTVLFLSEFSAEELEELLMRRHRLSGIRLTFAADKILSRSKQLRKLNTESEREEWLKKRYMQQLEEISTGNISVAMLFWLRSMRVSSDSRFEVETGLSLDVGNFRSISTEDLFALTALIQHEALSIPDFALVMNLTLDDARLRLISLHNRGIVIEKGDKYELHFFLYRSIIRLLYEKRFLH
jgi:hypothetical protein